MKVTPVSLPLIGYHILYHLDKIATSHNDTLLNEDPNPDLLIHDFIHFARAYNTLISSLPFRAQDLTAANRFASFLTHLEIAGTFSQCHYTRLSIFDEIREWSNEFLDILTTEGQLPG